MSSSETLNVGANLPQAHLKNSASGAGSEFLDVALRPKTFDDFPGQTRIKEKLRVFLGSALKRKKVLDHCLFSGPPGLGKTTLAQILSQEMGVDFVATSGPALQHKGDAAALLTGLKPNSLLFIDEIHRLPVEVEEYLYSAMEDFYIDIFTGEGMGAQTMRFPLSPFTLVGATTRLGLLKAPFRARFGILEAFSFYKPVDLCQILQRSSDLLGVDLGYDILKALASRSRGTPRIANRLLKRVRDFMVYKELETLSVSDLEPVMRLLDIDTLGLDALDRKLLYALSDQFNEGPVGIDSLAAALHEEGDTIQELCEPYMLQIGLIQKTPRGRVLTVRGREHLAQVRSEFEE